MGKGGLKWVESGQQEIKVWGQKGICARTQTVIYEATTCQKPIERKSSVEPIVGQGFGRGAGKSGSTRGRKAAVVCWCASFGKWISKKKKGVENSEKTTTYGGGEKRKPTSTGRKREKKKRKQKREGRVIEQKT